MLLGDPLEFPVVRFVSEPSLNAAVRLDLSSPDVFVAAAPNLGAPTLLGEPGSYGTDYDFRQITFTVEVNGDKAAATTVLTNLSRELLRWDNYLMVWLSDDLPPVWFHTYRSQIGELDTTLVWSARLQRDTYVIEVTLFADPWGLGERVTLASNVDVAMTTGLIGEGFTYYTIPQAIRGDAPAPLVVAASWDTDQYGYQHLVSVARHRGYIWPIHGSGDPWTAGPGDVNNLDSQNENAGGGVRVFQFVDNAEPMHVRISGTPAPAAWSAPVTNGRYRVLLRMGRTSTDAQFAVKFGQQVTGSYVYGDTVAVAWGASSTPTAENPETGFMVGGHFAWIDLGIFDFPYGSADRAGTTTPSIALAMSRTAGTGDALLDTFKLIPVDEDSTTLLVDHADLGPSGNYNTVGVTDSEAERFYYRNGAGAPVGGQNPALTGGWPTVVPGSENVVHFLQQTSLTRAENDRQETPDRISEVARVTLSYLPRYLNFPSA